MVMEIGRRNRRKGRRKRNCCDSSGNFFRILLEVEAQCEGEEREGELTMAGGGGAAFPKSRAKAFQGSRRAGLELPGQAHSIVLDSFFLRGILPKLVVASGCCQHETAGTSMAR